ncbi:MAG: NUDIX domain-containing protein [Candidatus Freyarchaeota archaeon]|nr:NUDIX domain-containing protein [Candidatus Jordarchaeia archaeon]MBS7278246.1 NUDIX domain-containing protein [Candidatus Jordarchaeia archaeon]
MEREEAHRKNVKHLVIRILGFNREGMLLVQKRSFTKKSHPGMYTDSASGHVLYEENFSFETIMKSAERELWEEMGVRGILKPYLEQKFDHEDLELNYVFLALIKGEPRFNEEVEAENSGFKTVEQLRHMLKNEKFVSFAKELWEKFLADYPTTEAIKKLAESLEKNQKKTMKSSGQFCNCRIDPN